jgi:hypothetical protein
MDRDDIIRMAQEAGYVYHVSGGTGTYVQFYWDQLEQFAHLVAAAERERIKWDTIHSCHSECDKPVCVAIRNAVAEEREACAQIAHDTYEGFGPYAKGVDYVKQSIMIRIRERGAP